MLVKNVISEEMLTLSEVNDILKKVKKKQKTDEEIIYVKRKAIAHADKYSKIKPKDSRELVKKLSKFEKMKPEIAIKITDIMPKSADELRAIYAKERFTLTKEDLENVLNIVAEYL